MSVEPERPMGICILGSTGSIGKGTLDVVRSHPDFLRVVTIAANKSWEIVEQQIREFRPRLAVVYSEAEAEKLKEAVKDLDVTVLSGMPGLLEAVTERSVDRIVSAMVGSIGLLPTLEGIRAGRDICLANKETLVTAGQIVMAEAEESGVSIIPVDSEHSAIFQCLGNSPPESVKRIILTASGGPFRTKHHSELAAVTLEEALAHPNWKMGGKITIDSATLMNKGLEVIEAHWLFSMSFDQIQVVVHPQSIVHSIVEFVDGSMIAQMGVPDMRLPIQYALSYPARWPSCGRQTDLFELENLTFEVPRKDDFPCLDYAYSAGQDGGIMPCVMNAANEVAVEAFIGRRIRFIDIPRIIRKVMNVFEEKQQEVKRRSFDLDLLLQTDAKARQAALLHI